MTFDPWSRPVYPAPQPYRQSQAVHQPVAVVPRTPVQASPPVRPARPVAVAPSKPAFKPVTVPPPEQLGIALIEPAVVVPEPEVLGIRLE